MCEDEDEDEIAVMMTARCGMVVRTDGAKSVISGDGARKVKCAIVFVTTFEMMGTPLHSTLSHSEGILSG